MKTCYEEHAILAWGHTPSVESQSIREKKVFLFFQPFVFLFKALSDVMKAHHKIWA